MYIDKNMITMHISIEGSHPGGVDIQGYTDVGVTNMVVVTELILKSGITYYASVKGEVSFTMFTAVILLKYLDSFTF